MVKLPVFTRLVLYIIFASWLASFVWDLAASFALIPNEIQVPLAREKRDPRALETLH